ncbi:MAG: citrate lyase acyl carrier protein [Lachnospiraceae bacterium]|nr:citrate lyase acyl carrier protein [Lachnospiraceae bacterium]
MEILKSASAGTMESSDVYVEIEPGGKELEISLESVVEHQFGEAIMQVVHEVLAECGVDSGIVRVVDRGALECVLRARVETAVMRAGREAN